MDDARYTLHPSSDRDSRHDPATIATLLGHIRHDLVRQRFRLSLMGAQVPEVVNVTSDRPDVAVADVDRSAQHRMTPEFSDEARRLAVREHLNDQMRPILRAVAQIAGLDLAIWKARIDGPMPLTDPDLVQALPAVFASGAFREARRACRDLTLLPPELKVYGEKPFDLGFRGRPPAKILADHPCWDLPFLPGAQTLDCWTIHDASEFMSSWPPDPGDLKEPMDAWDALTADLWLRQHKLSDGQEADRRNPVVAYREGRTKKSPLKVLAGLDEDALLVLTDAVLCERLRRDVMAVLMQDRADLIHAGLEMVACGYLCLDDVRAALAFHDDAQEDAFAEAFAENDDWMSEWIVDWSVWLISRYDWPLVAASRA
ncbi:MULTISPECIES: hypothetical protein [Methylobacteriaceae]|jgi:hypothetical protein|uniref:Uncharacterized protein n=5 Tax=Methylobacteriaceae TaxID=119045 RepID=A0A509EAN3_9HYPH|nr:MULTISPECIES: hypothetical protein [Methylobacteriaceae]KIU34569.1 hypothetical protein SR39_10700 [Methylobacterium radiotolerans]MBD8907327.1 hypothetical protein [Methylorubrum zatmanii]MBY0139825.1 hypothetical protein [Methylorubrum populi]MBZ6416273.1 hypothetical protein [Methylobacterium sp.]MDV2987609.1 hypothetical protein [Methylobacteriaceae bacterium AG10]